MQRKKIAGITGVIILFLIMGLFPETAVFAAEPEPETVVLLAEDIIADSKQEDLFDEAQVSLQDNVMYLPDVRAEMSNASFWAEKLENADEVLADRAMIEAVNDAILHGSGTDMKDLRNWSQETFDGMAQNTAAVASGEADAEYFWNRGVRYKEDGTKYASYAEAKAGLFDPLINNGIDPDAVTDMPVKYAVCVNRTCLRAYPTEHPLYDDPSDPDFDYLYLTLLRVNEPLILKTRSADGNYYLAISSSTSGWVPAADVAICADKEEWLSAWDIAPENTLVVYGDKIYTEDSYYAPETANKLLSMGTCLELADPEDPTALIINRRAYNNHIVWLPVRKDNGTYKKELALIGENRKVSEGFLPLTSANLLMVAMNQLGDTYGWGGMLTSNDCSGYARDVYKCFGIEMARNTTGQTNQPVYKYDLNGMSAEEKAEVVKDLPPGSLLIFNGHAMLYLGEDNGKFYVISSVSDVVLDVGGSAKRVRGALINTMDIHRGRSYNYITWLEAIHTAEIPYYSADYVRQFVYKTAAGNGQQWTRGSGTGPSFTFRRTVNNASALRHFTGVQLDGNTVAPENYSAKEGGVILTFTPGYLNGIPAGPHTVTAVFDDGNAPQASFTIIPKGTAIKKLIPAKKSMTIKWKKQTLQTTGYQIQYALNKKFTSGKKTATLKGAEKGSLKVKKLKSGKKYYVRIRTFEKVNGKNYYSAWSQTKSVKIK